MTADTNMYLERIRSALREGASTSPAEILADAALAFFDLDGALSSGGPLPAPWRSASAIAPEAGRPMNEYFSQAEIVQMLRGAAHYLFGKPADLDDSTRDLLAQVWNFMHDLEAQFPSVPGWRG